MNSGAQGSPNIVKLAEPGGRRGRRFGWPARYAASVVSYSWRWQRARIGPWLLTVVAVGAVLSVATATQLLVSVGQSGLAQQRLSASQIQVFLTDTASSGEQAGLRERLAQVPGVERVTFRSKDEAAALARRDRELAPLAVASGGNPFPASFVVQLRDPAVGSRVAASVAHDPAVDPAVPTSVTAHQAQRVSVALSAVRIGAWALDIVALGVGMLVALTLLRGELRSRADELRMLALVGVPRIVIRLPLILQSLSVSIVASVIAVLSLLWVAREVVPWVASALPFLELGNPGELLPLIAMAAAGGSCLALGSCGALVRLPR